MTDSLPPNDPLKAAWLSQSVETPPMTAIDLATAATRFERKVRRRNLIEYAAGAFVVIAFGGMAIFGHQGWIVRLGEALGVLGVGFILWQLHLRGSPTRTPAAASSEGLLAFQRAELVRQRDALRSVPLWYLLPIVPSFAVIDVGRWVQGHVPGRSLGADHLAILVGSGVCILILAGVWLLNALGARRLDHAIAKIDALRRD